MGLVKKVFGCTIAGLLALNIGMHVSINNKKYEKPLRDNWLMSRLSAEPDTLNPITASDAYESRINSYVMESLLKRNLDTLEMEPELAESYEVSEDRMEFVYHLRRDVKWHDGHPFTSEDVIFSYEKIMDPKVDAPHLRHYYRDVESVVALDDYTVKFKYKRPYFLALEFTGGMGIIPKHIFRGGNFNENPFARHPIGTGPFKFVEWKTGRRIVLERNEEYWGEKPKLDKIIFKIITDDVVAFHSIKNGDIDFIGLRPIQWARQSDTKRFKKNVDKYTYFPPNYSYIGWNMTTPYFNDKRVRRAMTHLINKEKICKYMHFGLSKLVTGTFYVNAPEYTAFEPYEYNPEKAKKLLDEAGWTDSDNDGIRDKDGMEFNFELLIPGGGQGFIEQLATMLKEDLEEIGIKMSIRRLEWSVFTQNLNERKFEATTLGWSLGVEQDPYQLWHSSQAEKGSNFVGFKNEEADRLIEAARPEFDREKRIKFYHRLNEIIHEEQPYTFLFCYPSLVAVNKDFHGVEVHKLGLDPREWWIPEEKLKLQKY